MLLCYFRAYPEDMNNFLQVRKIYFNYNQQAIILNRFVDIVSIAFLPLAFAFASAFFISLEFLYLEGLPPPVSSIDYHASGQIAKLTYANGAMVENTYDDQALYRLTRRLSTVPDGPGSTIVQDLNYAYDAVGNILSIVDESAVNEHESVFEYDDLHRLVSTEIDRPGGGYSQTFAYDAIGNMIYNSAVGDYLYEGATETGNYANPHAVTKIVDEYNEETEIQYDANGNVTHYGPYREYIWDYNNRLVMASMVSIIQKDYVYLYDHAGTRIASGHNKDLREFISPYYNVEIGGEATKHILAGNLSVATIQGSDLTAELTQLFSDHLGSVTVVAQLDGTVQEKIGYAPFGSMDYDTVTGAADPEQRKYIGKEYDTDTGLLYLEARYYNPTIGRFLSQDIMFLTAGFDLSDPQSLNAYAYSRNNPLRYTDANGEWFRDLVNNVAGYSVGLIGGTASAIGFGIGYTAQAISHPIYTAKQLYGVGKVVAQQGKELATQSQARQEAMQGAKLAYNDFESKSAYEQGGKVGGVTGNIMAGIIIARATPEGIAQVSPLLSPEGSFVRAGAHVLRDHPTRYPGMSTTDIASIARDTYNNATVIKSFSGIDKTTGNAVYKQYFGDSNRVFIMTNAGGPPTVFNNSNPAAYIERALRRDAQRYGQ